MRHLLASLALLVPLFAISSPAAADDASTCITLDNIVTANNDQAPFMTDEITRSEVAVNDCAARSTTFNWTILSDQSGLQDNWREQIGEKFRQGFCAQADFVAIVNSGWQIVANWTTQDGQVYSTTASCQ